jgi:hypothetical protein
MHLFKNYHAINHDDTKDTEAGSQVFSSSVSSVTLWLSFSTILQSLQE